MAGRPKMDENEKKTKQIRIRLTEKEHETLLEYAKMCHKNVSELIRERIFVLHK